MKSVLIFSFCLSLAPLAHATQAPESVFNRSCQMCHNGQLPMAPRKGDTEAWKPRLAQGQEVLVKHVTEGFNAMPPRGLCMDCTAQDYAAVIDWMSKP
ncbi:c-type cytochrome [Pseudomonas mosselii]|uniref:c-type cytochrome n=1 Tax=Pseudomonas mosselii TaxID=78327 RepID=UPI000A0FA1E2|nr:c-type cytochrome [Pseudomonas mosselii]MDH1658449.1 c-type cytochrome [Pseudomonas mosselii]MDH1718275.1 c-type cytochrome [Pseudomonas mosselii]MDH1723874.1 c-type cytochrome [Pseudomonas mosselii]MEB5931287.1 c-type cytochrome [Pseudomonas mosselii]ORT69766.1 cytochrome c5 family protein [Pseudomonas mosselii]